MAIDSLSSREDVPEYVRKQAEDTLTMFKNYRGPQAVYIMDDLVGLSLNKLGQMSQGSEQSLAEIKDAHYARWSLADFKSLLEILSQESPYFKELIENARKDALDE